MIAINKQKQIAYKFSLLVRLAHYGLVTFFAITVYIQPLYTYTKSSRRSRSFTKEKESNTTLTHSKKHTACTYFIPITVCILCISIGYQIGKSATAHLIPNNYLTKEALEDTFDKKFDEKITSQVHSTLVRIEQNIQDTLQQEVRSIRQKSQDMQQMLQQLTHLQNEPTSREINISQATSEPSHNHADLMHTQDSKNLQTHNNEKTPLSGLLNVFNQSKQTLSVLNEAKELQQTISTTTDYSDIDSSSVHRISTPDTLTKDVSNFLNSIAPKVDSMPSPGMDIPPNKVDKIINRNSTDLKYLDTIPSDGSLKTTNSEQEFGL